MGVALAIAFRADHFTISVNGAFNINWLAWPNLTFPLLRFHVLNLYMHYINV